MLDQIQPRRRTRPSRGCGSPPDAPKNAQCERPTVRHGVRPSLVRRPHRSGENLPSSVRPWRTQALAVGGQEGPPRPDPPWRPPSTEHTQAYSRTCSVIRASPQLDILPHAASSTSVRRQQRLRRGVTRERSQGRERHAEGTRRSADPRSHPGGHAGRPPRHTRASKRAHAIAGAASGRLAGWFDARAVTRAGGCCCCAPSGWPCPLFPPKTNHPAQGLRAAERGAAVVGRR